MKKKLHYPKLSNIDIGALRIGGPGLGNLLFPVLRAFIASLKDKNSIFIYPTWRQLKIGPFIRKEKDKRTYGNVFIRRSYLDWYYFFIAKVATIPFIKKLLPYEITSHSGLKKYFYDLDGYQKEIRDYLKKIINTELKENNCDISIHVRQGDFLHDNEHNSNGHNIRIQNQWYIKAVLFILSNWQLTRPQITIFSDGEVGYLKNELMQYADVKIDRTENAMEALIYL